MLGLILPDLFLSFSFASLWSLCKSNRRNPAWFKLYSNTRDIDHSGRPKAVVEAQTRKRSDSTLVPDRNNILPFPSRIWFSNQIDSQRGFSFFFFRSSPFFLLLSFVGNSFGILGIYYLFLLRVLFFYWFEKIRIRMNLMEDKRRGFWNKIDSCDASLDSDEYIFVYFFFFFFESLLFIFIRNKYSYNWNASYWFR